MAVSPRRQQRGGLVPRPSALARISRAAASPRLPRSTARWSSAAAAASATMTGSSPATTGCGSTSLPISSRPPSVVNAPGSQLVGSGSRPPQAQGVPPRTPALGRAPNLPRRGIRHLVITTRHGGPGPIAHRHHRLGGHACWQRYRGLLGGDRCRGCRGLDRDLHAVLAHRLAQPRGVQRRVAPQRRAARILQALTERGSQSRRVVMCALPRSKRTNVLSDLSVASSRPLCNVRRDMERAAHRNGMIAHQPQ